MFVNSKIIATINPIIVAREAVSNPMPMLSKKSIMTRLLKYDRISFNPIRFEKKIEKKSKATGRIIKTNNETKIMNL